VPDRKYLSSKQVAELLGVSLGSVANWERQQKLVAHRTPGGHRRFSKGEVRRYCLLHGLPIPEQLGTGQPGTALSTPVVLVVHGDPLVCGRLVGQLPERCGLDLRHCDTAIGLGFELGHSSPSVLVVDLVRPIVSWVRLVETCARLRTRPAILGLLEPETPRPTPTEDLAPATRVLLESPSDAEVVESLLDLLAHAQSDSSGPWEVAVG